MDFFDKLKIGERLEAMAGDAGKSVKTALTPKAPFPLSISGIKDTASKKLDTTMSSATDAAEQKMRSKASTLQDNTIGKVTTAVDDRVTSEVGRVEKKVDDTVAAAEKTVDDTIDDVGKTVDGGIASANKSLDKALGRSEEKDGKAAPLASGFTKVDKKAAKKADKKAAKLKKKADKKADRASSEPDTAADADTETPIGFDKPEAKTDADTETDTETDAETPIGFDKPGAEDEPRHEATVDTATETPIGFDKPEPKTEATTEATVEPEGNFDEFTNSDAGVDYDGDAAAAALDRKNANNDAGPGPVPDEETDEDDGTLGPGVEGPEDLSGEGEVSDVPAEDVLDAEAEQHKGETDDQDTARLEFKKKIRTIRNELHHLENGSTATGSGKDPWIAFFIASAKFKKKIALRDLKDELAGKKPDAAGGADKNEDEDGKTEDETPAAVDEPGRESEDETEVEIKSGMLRRGTKSKNAGDPVDTSAADPESADGRMIYAADKSHNLFIAYRPVKNNDFTQLLDRGKIVVAGEISVKDGKIDYMNNNDSGSQESEEDFAALLQGLRDQGTMLDFDVDETESKAETTAEAIVEEAEEKAPEPEQVDLLTAMKKNDAWKAIAKDFSETLIAEVAEKQNWKVDGEQIVDATGPLDPESARTTLQKAASKALATEAAAMVAKRAGKGAAATVDA